MQKKFISFIAFTFAAKRSHYFPLSNCISGRVSMSYGDFFLLQDELVDAGERNDTVEHASKVTSNVEKETTAEKSPTTANVAVYSPTTLEELDSFETDDATL